YDVDAITVHHEPLPQSIAPVTANAIDSYGLPDIRHQYLPRLRFSEHYADGGRGDFPIARDGSFAFVVPFQDGPGVYTVVVWVKPHGATETIAASNISVRVSEPAGGASLAAGDAELLPFRSETFDSDHIQLILISGRTGNAAWRRSEESCAAAVNWSSPTGATTSSPAASATHTCECAAPHINES